MGRRPGIWKRKQDGFWYTTIAGNRFKLDKDKSAAHRLFVELLNRSYHSPVTQTNRRLVAEVLDEFLSWYEKNRTRNGFKMSRYALQSFIDYIPPLMVSDLRPFHVTKFLDSLSHANATKNTLVSRLVIAFNWAVKQGLIESNPIKGTPRPPMGRREQLVSREQFQSAWTKAEPELQDILTALWEQGCRPFEARLVEARHYSEGSWKFPSAESKGKKHPRTIWLTPNVEAITQRLIERYPQGPLFRTLGGRPWTQNYLGMRIVLACAAAGVDPFAAYALRHTFATNALLKGMDILTVAHLLGHSNTQMLERHYAHLLKRPDYLKEQAKRAAQS